MKTPNRIALVTGASGGFGYEFAHLLAEDGYDLILVARRKEKLNELALLLQKKYSIHAHVFTMDMAKERSAKALYLLIKDRGLQIDVLINNAGIGSYGKFYEKGIQADDEMIRLNISTLTALTKLCVKDMVKHGRGHILNVASLAAFQPAGPMMAVYFASKSYVLSFSRSIRAELKGTGVSVTALCPGPTKTAFGNTDHVQTTRMFKLANTSAREVAEAGYKALKRNRAVVVPGLLNKLLAIGGELPPRWIALQVNKYLLNT